MFRRLVLPLLSFWVSYCVVSAIRTLYLDLRLGDAETGSIASDIRLGFEFSLLFLILSAPGALTALLLLRRWTTPMPVWLIITVMALAGMAQLLVTQTVASTMLADSIGRSLRNELAGYSIYYSALAGLLIYLSGAGAHAIASRIRHADS
jgi:hypothetical protein